MIRILEGDCREVMRTLEPASIDAIVCDPPYELGFMGKAWDGTGIANDPKMWAEALRVLKPGGHLLAFSGTRTYHRMVCAIEDAGFEIRDQIGWVYGSGFPKSLDVSKAIDKVRDEDRAPLLKLRAWLNARREESGLSHGEVNERLGRATNGGGRSSLWMTNPTNVQCPTWDDWLALKQILPLGEEMDAEVWRLNGRKGTPGEAWQSAEVTGVKEGAMAGWSMDGGTKFVDRKVKAANSDAARQWQGWGTALKPAWEPIVLARKPLGTVGVDVRGHVERELRSRGVEVIRWRERPASDAASSGTLRRSSSTPAQPMAAASVGPVAVSVTASGERPIESSSEPTGTHGAQRIESTFIWRLPVGASRAQRCNI